MGNKTIRVRRLGSVTFGIVLISTGILLLVNAILPALNLALVFRFWPVVLIALGIEVLAGSQYKSSEVVSPEGQIIEQNKVVYDIPAVVMMGITLFVTFMLAWAEWFYVNETRFDLFQF